MIRAYLIDTPERVIREVEHDGTIEDIYKKLGFDCKEFREIMLNGSRDCLYIDAEALDKAQTMVDLRQHLYSHKRYHSMLIGRGFILGHDEFGDTKSPHISIETARQEITFHGSE